MRGFAICLFVSAKARSLAVAVGLPAVGIVEVRMCILNNE